MRKHAPEVRVIIYSLETKDIKQFYSITNVNCSLGFGGMGSATVTMRSRDLRLFMPGKTVQLNSATGNKAEVDYWVDYLRSHNNNEWFQWLLDNMDYRPDELAYKIFEPVLSIIGLVWIDARGRDGRWYSLFSGVITHPNDSVQAGQEPIITLQCSTWKYFLDYYPIVTGLNMFGRGENSVTRETQLETILTSGQPGVLRIPGMKENIFQNEDAISIFKKIITTVNNLITIGENESIFGNWGLWFNVDQQTNSYEKDVGLTIPTNFRNTTPNQEDYLPDNFYLGDAYIQDRFDTYEIYKRMIGNRLEFFVSDKEFASSIIQRIASSVFADWYIDSKGNLRMELPAFNAFPDVDNGKLDFHGRNYIVSRKDESFESDDFDFNAADVITFVELPFTWLEPAQDPTETAIFRPGNGFAKSSDSDLLKFGLREFRAQPVFSDQLRTSVADKIKNNIAQALLLKVNQKAGAITYTFNQRPDFELNKTIFNVDRGQVHLITSISHNIVPYSVHTTNVVCEYSRNVGDLFPDPWLALEELNPEFDKEENKGRTNINTGTQEPAND